MAGPNEKWIRSHILLLLSLSLQFHYEKMQAQFFFENANIACALKNVSARFSIRIMKRCVSRACSRLTRDKRAGEGHGLA